MRSITRSEDFIRGALFITAGGLISRVLGALYRPFAQLFIGDTGLGLATPPAYAYQVILAISSVGLNVAISRLVSERLAMHDYLGARRVFRVATGVLLASGILFSFLFGIGSRWLAEAQSVPGAWLGFVVLAPAILLVTLECMFRGLYQGMQQMFPSAVSQVVEQAGRVFAGSLLVALLAPVALNYGAAGFNAGSTVGALLGVIYGAWVYFRQRPDAAWIGTDPGVHSLQHESVPALTGKILSIALPLSILGAVLPTMGLLDSFILGQRLETLGIVGREYADILAHLTNAATLRDLPAILTAALYVSLVPAITESVTVQRLDEARSRAATAFRVTLLFGLPATVALFAGARDAYGVMYTGPGYSLLAPLAWSTIFLMLQQTSSGILQGMGLIWLSVQNVVIGVSLKMILTYWWAAIPTLKATGAAYATVIGFAAAALLNLWSLRQTLGLGLQVRDDVGRPALASALMGLAIWFFSPMVHDWLPGHRLPGLVVVMFGGVIYAMLILAVGGVRESDLRQVPGFRAGWVRWLTSRKLLRQ